MSANLKSTLIALLFFALMYLVVFTATGGPKKPKYRYKAKTVLSEQKKAEKRMKNLREYRQKQTKSRKAHF